MHVLPFQIIENRIAGIKHCAIQIVFPERNVLGSFQKKTFGTKLGA